MRSKWNIILMSACFTLMPGLLAGEGDKKEAKAEPIKSEQKAETPQVTSGGGMVYTVPGRTAEGVMPAEISEALAEMINTSSEGLVEKTLPDGTVTVDLQGRFQSAMVVTVGDDGKLHSGCYATEPNHKCDKEHAPKVKDKQ